MENLFKILLGVLIFHYSLLGFTRCRYLIICNEKFIDDIQPLKKWKSQKGMRAEVVSVPTGITRDSVKKIIKSYNPEYVLLVGDRYLLPPGDSFYPWNQLLLSDNFYGDISGDYRMEIPVGRFPCQTSIECSVMVQKTLAYERFPLRDDTLWYRKGTLVFMWDPGGLPANPVYSCEFPYDDSIMRLSYTKIDTIFNDTLFGQKDFDDFEDIISALNIGSGMVLYRGHARENWQYPFTLNPEDERLQNNSKLPVIISGSCYTIFKGTNPVGERWLRVFGKCRTLKGAVAFLGTQLSGLYGRWRGRFVRTFLKAVFAQGCFKLGKAFLFGKDSIAAHPILKDSNEHFYKEWSLFGDPELNLWTKVPKPISVSYNSFFEKGEYYLNVKVRDSLTTLPVANALVCITEESYSDLYSYGYTDKRGEITFLLDSYKDNLILTVTAQNYFPFERTFPIFPYTNPSIYYTGFNYPLKERSRVFLEIYDIKGRLVKKLDEGIKDVGFYKIFWDGKDNKEQPVRSGIYFLYLKTSQFVKLRKVVLICP